VAGTISHADGDVEGLLIVEALGHVESALDLARLDEGREELEGDTVLLVTKSLRVSVLIPRAKFPGIKTQETHHLSALLNVFLFDVLLVKFAMGHEVIGQHFLLVHSKGRTNGTLLQRITAQTT
jgi:hypothetical protein